ncbi:MAG: shikimate kinase [Brevinematales bacterium]|nr:shikimate kinase [Brevinematales bacterium]
MKKQIFLIGYRATGKTTIGKELSRMTGWKLIDTDEEIEKSTGIKIKDIFEKYGESKFRDLESQVLKNISSQEQIIVSTGGGIILRNENREIIKRGLVILLYSSPETIIKRMTEESHRPALTDLPLEEEVRKTLSERDKLYNEIFHIKVYNENITISSILSLLKNCIPFITNSQNS